MARRRWKELIVRLLKMAVAIQILLNTGCAVRVQGKRRPLITHGKIGGSVELLGGHLEDKQSSAGVTRRDRTTLTEEILTLKTKGDVYNPNFLFYNATVGFGLVQQRFTSNEADSENSSGDIDVYDIDMQFLRQKAYPFTLRFHRADDFIPQRFQEPLRSKTDSASGFLSIRSDEWPMQFQLSSDETEQSSIGGGDGFFFRRQDDRFRYSLGHDFTDFSKLKFEYERNEITQFRTTLDNQLTENDSRLSHDWVFGPKKRHALNSSVSLLDQSGTNDLRFFAWEELLRLEHSLSFSTNYFLRYSDYEREGLSTDRIFGQAGFTHSLYESLTTNGHLFASELDFSGGADISQRGAQLGFRYTKRNPWGRLVAGYRPRFISEKQRGGDAEGFANAEPHVFNDPENITLNQTGVIESSILVRDTVGNILVLGADYTVVTVGNETQLNIIPTGPNGVVDGEVLFVNYDFVTAGDRDEDTLNQAFSIRQDFFNGFSPYFIHRRQDQDITSDNPDVEVDEFNINTYGIEYNKDNLRLLGEHSDDNSTQQSSVSDRVEGSYTWQLNPDTSAFFSLGQRNISYGEPEERDVSLFSARADIFSRLSDYHELSITVDYRDEDDSISGRSKGLQYRTELRYQYRKLSVRLGVAFNSLDRRSSNTESNNIYVQVKRRF